MEKEKEKSGLSEPSETTTMIQIVETNARGGMGGFAEFYMGGDTLDRSVVKINN